jgi:hypothetical protein
MHLDLPQIRDLSEDFHTAFESVFDLALYTAIFDYDLLKEVPDGSLKSRAFQFISFMNSRGRHMELLNALKTCEYPLLRLKAGALLEQLGTALSEEAGNGGDKAKYLALNLGSKPFLGRGDLREHIPNFACRINRNENEGDKTHVLMVTGREPCGKSYTYHFLEYLANHVAEADITMPLSLPEKTTPRKFFKSVGWKLGVQPIEANGFPDVADNPQESHFGEYLDWLEGYVTGFEKPKWLIIDDFNQNVKKEVEDAAEDLAKLAEGKSGSKLWVAILGYNRPVRPPELEKAIIDQAKFPGSKAVADYLKTRAQEGKLEIDLEKAQEWAAQLIGDEKTLDKELMELLRTAVIHMGDLLAMGILPNSESIAAYFIQKAQEGEVALEMDVALQSAAFLIQELGGIRRDSMKDLKDKIVEMGKSLSAGNVSPTG